MIYSSVLLGCLNIFTFRRLFPVALPRPAAAMAQEPMKRLDFSDFAGGEVNKSTNSPRPWGSSPKKIGESPALIPFFEVNRGDFFGDFWRLAH